ncbi:abnormal spindle-like microcephaly-associated protein [Alligator mississippiensis]|uniref:Abnormal spindle-like microcephaly-associated protein n=1 Tax=Alligator mississippiensis TaxID=8496 RepID=A0A151NCJ1_ALLMI|nr:abnormal spindle-like microcephaly-associated protein [Alligator mississippiensis]
MAAGGAAAWELSPARRRRWGEAEDEEEPPAVLTLSHFSRPPFLSFGRVRLGVSRARLLGIDNPDAAAADVTVDRFPPPARGFGLERRRFLVQSGERIFISVTWTPLEEGRVRELITFVVNGIVKHQAILLGVAEQPERKKKSLGDGIRRKNPSEASITTRTRKTQSNIRKVNKTFRVSQKADKVRSPLQSCENLEIREDNVSSRNKSLLTLESNLPISPISPVLQEEQVVPILSPEQFWGGLPDKEANMGRKSRKKGEIEDHKVEASSLSTGSTSLCRKRKSEVFFGNHKAMAPECTEEMETKRIFVSCMDNKEQTTQRLPVSKSFTSREKLTWRKKAGSSLQKASKTSNRTTKPVVGVAQSHLTFVKPLKTVIPRHPMPFVAKNMFYDERWKEKQQRGFTWWLNFILTPDDFTVKTNISQVNAAVLVLGAENYKASVPKAPTKDEMSLRAYTARCRLNRLRCAACRLFTCEAMVKAIKKLEVEIETRRLLVRKDRHLWKDIGERQKILNWLLSYNPLWLRIGLETVYGELIALESNSDVMGLATFILNRLLWNPDIAAEYRHPSVPHLYRDGHEAALSKFTLKKLLLLVCFLDCAKQSRIIDHDPCLFCKDAEFKTSKDILLAFARDFLSGEGDLSRHLGFLGLPVNHVQTPLDEFDFAVTNLAVDLQCGIRLVRAMELLTKNWTLSEKLRVPAISRLQKMHNVDIALNVLKERGVQLQDETGASISSRDIVDRHRERTLALLWKIVFAFQVEVSLNVEHLKEEIEFLKNAHSIKTKMAALNISVHKGRKNSSGYPSSESYQENVKLLMDWVNAVCGFYNTKVENFTVSFSDGRVLCYLIHHYHPYYMPLEAVCQHTTQTVECTKNGTVVLNSSSESDTSLNVLDGTFGQTITTSVLYKELLDNEKNNFQLINAAVSDLGGIPAMIHHSDMSNTIPDEKVVITYLSFLCSRLLDLRKETRAARLIQSAWRKHRMKVELKLFQEKDKAARIIQRAVINFLSRRHVQKEVTAAVFIQKHWRRFLAEKRILQLKRARLEKIKSESAAVIQMYWRSYSTRKRYLQLRYYVILVQARIRIKAALILQNHYRSHLAMKRQREAYLLTQKSIIVIQTRIRGFNEWRRFQKIKQSTVKIQAFYRGFSQRRQYLQYKSSVVLIQQHYRAHCLRNMERQKYLQIKAAALRLQALYRGFEARQLAAKMRSAQMIQACFRGYRARKELAAVVKAAGVIQRYHKTRQQRIWFLKMKVSTVVIQRRWRAILSARATLQQFLAVKEAAVKIQLAYRRYSARKLIAKKQQAACLIQAAYRGFKERQKFLQQKVAALVIQKHVRARWDGRLECIKYHRTRATIVKLQAYIRGWLVRKKILEEKQKKRLLYFTDATYHHLSAIKIQRSYRSYLVLKHAQMQISSVICIQRWFRAKLQQKQFLQDCQKIVTIQRKARAWLNRRNEAATIIQRAVRRFLCYQHRRKLNSGIMKFQALWRGHSWRKSHDTAKTKALRHSLEIANKNSREENKLCNRTAIAIEYLLQYKHISYILAALKHLEVVTRLSPRCCEDMDQSGAIFTIFTLIRSCNRSVPCMDVIKYSIQVLLNVSKYEKTTQAVYEVESSIDTLLDLLQRYRGKAGDKISEKGGSIFTKTCCLLAILLKDSRRASEIQSKPRAVVRIQSLYKVTARKHKMEAERTLSKHKTAASVHGNYFVPVTPVQTKVVSRIKPDWVLRKDNVREIVDPLQAIRMVMDTLGVPYN